MNQTIKLVERNEGARANLKNISDRFLTISNWNTYSEGNTVSDDTGNKYIHKGVVMNAVYVEPINK